MVQEVVIVVVVVAIVVEVDVVVEVYVNVVRSRCSRRCCQGTDFCQTSCLDLTDRPRPEAEVLTEVDPPRIPKDRDLGSIQGNRI